jgi:hypothetical protein
MRSTELMTTTVAKRKAAVHTFHKGELKEAQRTFDRRNTNRE